MSASANKSYIVFEAALDLPLPAIKSRAGAVGWLCKMLTIYGKQKRTSNYRAFTKLILVKPPNQQ
jgi:hypothetical protein